MGFGFDKGWLQADWSRVDLGRNTVGLIGIGSGSVVRYLGLTLDEFRDGWLGVEFGQSWGM